LRLGPGEFKQVIQCQFNLSFVPAPAQQHGKKRIICQCGNESLFPRNPIDGSRTTVDSTLLLFQTILV